MPGQSGGRPQRGEARHRLGAELRRIRVAAGKTQRDIHGPTGSGHASNVENGHTQPSWDFIEKYLACGGEAQYLRSLYELARAESDEQRTEQRRGSQPGSFSPPRAPQEVAGLGFSDIRRHYLVERREERIAVAGTANITRFGHEFDAALAPLLEALEEHVVLLKLLGEATSPSTLTVRIGHENPDELSAASVVTTGYGPGDRALATLGVVGPTRMDYPGTIASVGAVARYVSQILAANS